METRELKALLGLMQEYGLIELEIEDKKGKVRLVRSAAGVERTAAEAAHVVTRPVPVSQRRASAKAAQPGSVNSPAAASAPAEAQRPGLSPSQRLVESPMVGTFYRAAAPDAAPFVEEGDTVRKGQPLCIIEAMKMMNEIEAEVAGRVVSVLCENGRPVEYGQALMVLEVG